MAFQPFGYRFEIESPAPLEKVKADIRSRKKRWFDPKDGPRGWIVGPFICLWMSALDRYGPMLFGHISRHNFGTRVRGRAGSDLNGIATLTLLLPLLVLLTYLAVRADQFSPGEVVIVGAVVLLCLTAFWMSHKERKHAEPLVRFIRDIVTPSGQALRARSASATISARIKMTVSGEEKPGPVSAESIHDALLNAGVEDWVILATAEEAYIQTLAKVDGFIVEKREGSHDLHFKAVRYDNKDSDARFLFSFEEVLAVLMAYAAELPSAQWIKWEKMEMPE